MIGGIASDERGAPIEGARVYFTEAPAPVPDIAALTGADGSFFLGAPVEGTYTIECSADGFAPARATVASPDCPRLMLTLRAL